jgi:carboxymethylenebutenolidase
MKGTSISISVNINGEHRDAYLATPPAGTGPGLLVLDDVGADEHRRKTADEYAMEGYVALAPDLRSLDDAQAVHDVDTALEALRARPAVRGKIAVLGYGSGGRLAFLAAARLKVDAAIAYYPVGLDAYLGEASAVGCPILFHLAENDQQVTAAQREKIRAAFAAHDNVEFFVYRGADRGFSNRGSEAYDRISAQIARSRTIGLLRTYLGPRYDLNAMWERHGDCEFALRDVDATMATMVDEPYVNHIPTLTGGIGKRELYRFYKHHFIPGLPKDTKMIPISRTIGSDSVVDEVLFCFTHDQEVDFLLPGIAPTGKWVEVPLVVIIQFRGDKVAHEHIYWDSASALVQVGALDPKGLPTTGIDTARKAIDEKSIPSNRLMARWKDSAGKD